MKELIRKEIIRLLKQTHKLLEENKPATVFQELSNDAIQFVALHKDLDMISVSVLLYSLYKTQTCLSNKQKEFTEIIAKTLTALQTKKFGIYNRNMRSLFLIMRECNAAVKHHLYDVLHAARIKKGSTLHESGLSIGQAAGLMGLSNWDLQSYAALTSHTPPAVSITRLKKALSLFAQ